MPKRSILVRAMLFAETASALLLIQLGLFTHPAMIIIPFALMAFVSLPREDFSNGDKLQCLELRSFFSSLLTPKHYSAFGLRKRQENTRLFVLPMMILRLICAIVVMKSLSEGCLVGCPYYQCNLQMSKGWTDRWMTAGFGTESMTLQLEKCFPEGRIYSLQNVLGTVCHHPREHLLDEHDHGSWMVFPARMVYSDFYDSLCNPEVGSIPGIMKDACYNEVFDPVAYHYCLSNPPGNCFQAIAIKVFFLQLHKR